MFETDNFEQEIRRDVPAKPNGQKCPNCNRKLRAPIEPYRALSGRTIKYEGETRCLSCGQLIDWT